MKIEQRVKSASSRLPTKTKIAMWWLIIVGELLTILNLVLLLRTSIICFGSPQACLLWPVFYLVGSMLYLLSGILIYQKSKLCWKTAMAFLIIAIICLLGIPLYAVIHDLIGHNMPSHIYRFLSGLLICLIPLILIILDRNKYFAMVRQQEQEKTAETQLTTKTIIAVCWLLTLGFTVLPLWIITNGYLYYIDEVTSTSTLWDSLIGLVINSKLAELTVLLCPLCIPPAIWILLKRKSAWYGTSVMLSILIIIFLAWCLHSNSQIMEDYHSQLVFFYSQNLTPVLSRIFDHLQNPTALLAIIFAIPLSLILLDRKNYLEMVHQRELKKKNKEVG